MLAWSAVDAAGHGRRALDAVVPESSDGCPSKRAEAAGETDAVIHWRIGGASHGGNSEHETVIRDGACEVHEGFGSEAARVTFTIGGADFLRLVTGNAAGPMLFMSGKLKIQGDMMFAANAASLFRIPKG